MSNEMPNVIYASHHNESWSPYFSAKNSDIKYIRDDVNDTPVVDIAGKEDNCAIKWLRDTCEDIYDGFTPSIEDQRAISTIKEALGCGEPIEGLADALKDFNTGEQDLEQEVNTFVISYETENVIRELFERAGEQK